MIRLRSASTSGNDERSAMVISSRAVAARGGFLGCSLVTRQPLTGSAAASILTHLLQASDAYISGCGC